ncbi:molecular chaperone TorD family protein [Bacillus sp. FJAT-29790]|uniref:TorD/DmsD family molecular chaperone n=1 Tax=Bacillus sp. FJAT-29790 TaxID=1895002 RepID=UPI001C24E746|nr:molecular chaperone TorD family protein [Bacillus sp. FJAT-29790]MBU8879632.1 molecular chaperone TorD family protein [Bacillus sp. FJAT-29790]
MNGTAIPMQEAVNIFYARQYAYDILRRFFLEEPSKAFLKEFVQINMIDFFPFKEDSEGIQEGIKDIKAFLSSHDVVNIERHYQKLHWDYTRMFIGPFEVPTPPWESSYVGKHGLLFQETTMNIRKRYEKYGIEVRGFNVEPDDHIGFELDFIYHLNELCFKAADPMEEWGLPELRQLLIEQKNFVDTHLLSFVPTFSQGVINEADTDFYRGLAKILHQFLLIDSNILKGLLSTEII